MNLDLLDEQIEKTASPAFKGQWQRIVWTPDLGAGEQLNIGVMVKDDKGGAHIKLVESVSRVLCLYDQHAADELKFLIRVLKSTQHREGFNLPSPNISFGPTAEVRGPSVKTVLDDLFHRCVPMAHDRRRNERISVSNGELKRSIYDELKRRTPNLADKIIPQGDMQTRDSSGKLHQLKIPLLGIKHIGGLASAITRDPDTAALNLLEMSSLLEAAHHDKKDSKMGLFVLAPDSKTSGFSAKELKSVHKRIDDVFFRLERIGIPVFPEPHQGALAEEIVKWAANG